jgi:hypothetical protein
MDSKFRTVFNQNVRSAKRMQRLEDELDRQMGTLRMMQSR